ncbi:MAG: hypothetical protein ACRDGF_10820 [Chloroflexota bacterium]
MAEEDAHASRVARVLEELPAPTAWPMLLAFGVVLAAFGIITSGVFFFAGLVIAVLSLASWMRLLVQEGRQAARHEGDGKSHDSMNGGEGPFRANF